MGWISGESFKLQHSAHCPRPWAGVERLGLVVERSGRLHGSCCGWRAVVFHPLLSSLRMQFAVGPQPCGCEADGDGN